MATEDKVVKAVRVAQWIWLSFWRWIWQWRLEHARRFRHNLEGTIIAERIRADYAVDYAERMVEQLDREATFAEARSEAA
jgi:hypothetical protein